MNAAVRMSGNWADCCGLQTAVFNLTFLEAKTLWITALFNEDLVKYKSMFFSFPPEKIENKRNISYLNSFSLPWTVHDHGNKCTQVIKEK